MSPAHPALLSELQFQDEPQEDWDKGRNSGFSQLHLKELKLLKAGSGRWGHTQHVLVSGSQCKPKLLGL